MKLHYGVISPQDWGLSVAAAEEGGPIEGLGLSAVELAERARANTCEWLKRQYHAAKGAFHGHYNAVTRQFALPNTVNLIAPWQLMAAYDRYRGQGFLSMARQAADWFYGHFVVSHPMSVHIGGVRDTQRREELWVKYAAEHIILSVGLFNRSGEERYLNRAAESAAFLVQSRRHGFAPRYDECRGEWIPNGWQSFGRAVEAYLELYRLTKRIGWLDQAVAWGEYGLTLQAQDGGFYLLDGEYYNSDIAADELRGLAFLFEITGRKEFLQAARTFADWHLCRQRDNGSWPVNIDRDGNVIADVTGPGDMSNLAVALLRLHMLIPDGPYLKAAMKALNYAISRQAVKGCSHPYLEDPNVLWGFWSWDPYYDYTLSADQSTHHVRAVMFFLDALPALAVGSRGRQPYL